MGFAITDMLMQSSLSSAPAKDQPIRRISYYDLVPSEDNFYSMQELEELQTAIELAGHILSNLIVTPLPDGKYKILSGHRRHAAVGRLLAAGKDEYEFLPCAVEELTDEDRDVREQVLLITANSQREKTAWDKLEEVRQMRDIARRTKQERGIAGRVRDLVAQSLHISSSRIAKYDSILNNLIPSLMEEIKANRLSISTAYDLSGLPADRQQASYDFYLNHGSRSAPLYKALFIAAAALGCTMRLDLAWALSDTFNGLMALPNLVGVFALRPKGGKGGCLMTRTRKK